MFPIGVIDLRFRVSGAMCNPHDKTYDLPIPEVITLIINLACKYSGYLRLPVGLFEELFQVRIGFRLAFLGFT